MQPTIPELAIPRLQLLGVIMARFFITLLWAGMGLVVLRASFEQEGQMTKARMDAAQGFVNYEDIIWNQFDTFHHSELPHIFLETHEKCLARGLNYANDHFLGFDFTEYPSIRNATMKWVDDNCQRLHHVPEAPQEIPREMKGWVKAVNKMHYYAQKAIARAKKRLANIRSWISGKPPVIDVEKKTDGAPSRFIPRYPTRLKLPFGIEAICCPGIPCQMDYEVKSLRILGPTTDDYAREVVAAQKRITQIKHWDKLADSYTEIIVFICGSVFFGQALFGIILAGFTLWHKSRSQPSYFTYLALKAPSRYSPHQWAEKRYAFWVYASQFGHIVALLYLSDYTLTRYPNWSLVLSYRIFGTAVASNIFWSLFSRLRPETIWNFVIVCTELILLFVAREDLVPWRYPSRPDLTKVSDSAFMPGKEPDWDLIAEQDKCRDEERRWWE